MPLELWLSLKTCDTGLFFYLLITCDFGLKFLEDLYISIELSLVTSFVFKNVVFVMVVTELVSFYKSKSESLELDLIAAIYF